MTDRPVNEELRSDEQLAVHVQFADSSLWPELAERVMRVIIPIVRHKVTLADCDDVAQDALVRFYGALPSYSMAKGALRIFVSVLARRQIADYYRQVGNKPGMVDIDDFADLVEEVSAAVNPGLDMNSLAQIAGPDKWPVVLDWLEGYTWAEIATRHDITEGAAKMRRRAALDSLRVHMEGPHA